MVKNPKIQALRALSIIAVVMIHTLPAEEIQVYVRPFINFGVATFLFLSGYLTDLSKIKIKQFYKKRILRVIIPYIIWTILYTTVGFVSSGGIDIKKYFINLVTAGAAATLYYIFVYIQFVLLTPLLGKLLHKKWWWVGLLVSPLSLIIRYYWLFSGVTPNKYISTIWGVSCLGWFLFYYLGLYFGNMVKDKKYNLIKLMSVYAVTIAVQILEGYGWYRLGDTTYGTQLKLSALLTNSVFVLMAYYYISSNKIKCDNKILITIGDYSFGIYLAHIMVIMILNKIPIWGPIPFLIKSFVVLAITLIIVIIGKKICGKRISRYLGLQ